MTARPPPTLSIAPYRDGPSPTEEPDVWCPASHRRRGLLRAMNDDRHPAIPLAKRAPDGVTWLKWGICPDCGDKVPLARGRYALHPRKFPCAMLCGHVAYAQPPAGWKYVADGEWVCSDCAEKARFAGSDP